MSLLSLLIYLGLSVSVFGLRVLPGLSTSYLGFWSDPGLLIWCLQWWPWAIRHGQNPFYCHFVWAPLGTDLTWMTSIPGLSLLAAPITLTLGPVAAYNILAVTGPALSAWAAYIVCCHITRAFWPSVFGGWIYGFSTYEWNHALWGHLFLSWALIPPLLLYLVLLLVRGAIAPRRLVLYFAAALVAQFSISVEVFATMTIFGALALLLAALLMPELRSRLYNATLLIGCAYALSAIEVSPFLCHFFLLHGVSREPIFPPAFFSNDLLAAFIPGPLNLVSQPSRQLGTVSENGAYLGPCLVLIVFFALSSWHRAEAKLLLLMLGVIYLASMGPRLYIMNHPTIPLPWSLISSYVPVLNNALPARFIVFGWLITAIIAAICLARNDIAVSGRMALALMCIIVLSPHPRYLSQAKTEIATPKFFSQHLYRYYLRPDENILIIPYSYKGNSMLWQAQAGMDFRMAEGWTGAAPTEFLRWPIVNALITGSLIPDYGDQFKAFLSRYNVKGIVVCSSTKGPWTKPLAALGAGPLETGDVTLYLIPAAMLRAYRHASVVEMERRADAEWFVRLLMAADRYVARGLELKALSPGKAAQLGLLPQDIWAESLEMIEAKRRMGGPMLWLGPYLDNMVAIGLVGSTAAIQPLITRYANEAEAVYFPYPDILAGPFRSDDTPEILLMVFGRQGLARAAGKARDQTALQSAIVNRIVRNASE